MTEQVHNDAEQHYNCLSQNNNLYTPARYLTGHLYLFSEIFYTLDDHFSATG